MEGADPDVVKLAVMGGNAVGGGVQSIEKPQISGGSAGWGVIGADEPWGVRVVKRCEWQ